jgi:hypothetical protein
MTGRAHPRDARLETHVYFRTVPQWKPAAIGPGWSFAPRAAVRAGAAALTVAALLGCGERPSGRRAWGEPCGASLPCGGELACVDNPLFPGGYCSLVCDERPCGDGAICDAALAPALCLAACEEPGDCRAGYQCWRGACRPGCHLDPASCGAGARCGEGGQCESLTCRTDAECGAGRRCEAGRCVAGPPSEDAGTDGRPGGEPCARDAECASGICLPADRGGVCSEACADPDDCIDAVPFVSACAPVRRGVGLATLCIPFVESGRRLGERCAADRDCASSTCVEGQCTEACAGASDCLRGQVCGEVAWGGGTFTGCGFAPGSGAAAVDLGVHSVRADRSTDVIVFASPPDAVSVTLRARVVSGDPLPLTFMEVVDPRRVPIFSLHEITEFRDPPARWIPVDTFDVITMLVPNATPDRIPYTNGRYAFRLGAFARGSGDTGRAMVQVDALIKRAPGGMVSAGNVDLYVYLVGVGLTADTAPSDTRVRAALDRFRDLLAGSSISLGNVQYFEVTGADATRYQVIDTAQGPDSELAGLFRLSAGRSGEWINVFLVRSINGGEGFHTLGIAGGIPGPSGIHGTGHSGVVVAFDPGVIGADGALAGHVLAHEVGHFLGLYHVTERARPCGPGETPPGCAPFGGTDTIDDTTYGDDANLMHWALVGSGTNVQLTRGQNYVLLRSALVR